MPDVYCYNGGNGSDGSSWANAYQTIQAAITAAGAGYRVYLASDHSETPGATTTWTCPAGANAPVIVISTSRTTDEYTKASAAQFDISGGNYDLNFDGNAAFVGVYFDIGDDITATYASGELIRFIDSTLGIGQATTNGQFSFFGADGLLDLSRTEINLGSGATSTPVIALSSELSLIVRQCSFTGSPGDRTSVVISCGDNNTLLVSGTDFSVFNNASLSSVISRDANTISNIVIDGCKPPSAKDWLSSAVYSDVWGAQITRSDGTNQSAILHSSWYGTTANSAVYRTGGASDGTEFSFLVTTTANCGVGEEYFTPWLYKNVSTGAQYFDVFVSHDAVGSGTAGALTDADCWLEIEYLATSGSTVTSPADDRAANILSGADQDSDSSTWSDGDTQQRLRVTATIGQAGIVKARVGFTKPSVSVWVDPQINVSAVA